MDHRTLLGQLDRDLGLYLGTIPRCLGLITDDEVQQQVGDDVELESYPQHRGR